MDDEALVPGADEEQLDAAAVDELDAASGSGATAPELTTLGGASTRLRIAGEQAADAAICPFLRTVADDGFASPFESPDPRNRCTAIGRPAPQSGRQQELVCLTSGHANCPRYLRGALLVDVPIPERPARSGPSAAVIGAAVALAIAASLSVAFLLVRGGFDLTLASPPPGQAAAVIATTGPSSIAPASTPSPASTPGPSPTATIAPSPSPTASPSPTPTAAATIAPTAVPTAAPTPRSDRYAVLVPCPSTPKCWIYTVRSGDNLTSIVNWFGVPIKTVRSMNPQLANPIRAGDKIRMPPPTR